MGSQRLTLLINYHLREGFICKLQDICSQALAVRTNDHIALLWRAVGLLLETRTAEALRELQPLLQSPQVGLAAKAALIHASGVAEDHDKDIAVMNMATELDEQSVSAPPSALLQLATFLWHTGSQERARACAERVLQQAPNDVAGLALLGWILTRSHYEADAHTAEPEDLDQALGLFQQALSMQPRHTESLLGMAHCHHLTSKPAAALEQINAVIAQQPWFWSVLADKAKLLVAMHEWEHALEVVGQLLQQEPDNIQALHLSGVYLLAREGSNAGAAAKVRALLVALERQEPRNPALWLRLAQPYARLAGQDTAILGLSSALVLRACKAAPSSPEYAVEAGYQALLQGDVQGALAHYSRASHLHELDMEAMYGSIECDLLNGKVKDAASQLEFLKEVGSAGVGSLQAPDLLYLQGLLAWKQGQDLSQAASMLDQALQTRIEGLLEAAPSPSFFTQLNPSRILGVVRLFLGAFGGTPKTADEPVSPLLTKCERLLEVLLKHCPGMAEAHLLLAESHHLAGDSPVALRKVAHVLHQAPDTLPAHLLLTRIYLHQGKVSAAQEALEQAVGMSFGIRESAAYACMRGQLLVAQGRDEEAERLLQAAMAMPGVKRQQPPQSRPKSSGHRVAEPTLSERLAVYLLLAETLSKAAKIPEATKVMEDAGREFLGGPEQALVAIAKAQLSLTRGEPDAALSTLKGISRQSPHFMRALTLSADIHLKHRKDPAAYVHCYSQLAEQHMDYESYRLLGSALLRIQEPEKAIKALEAALEQQPKDGDLAAQIGDALASTHQYRRALDYYHKAVRNSPANLPLQLHLANLLLRLKSWDSAEKVVRSMLARPEEGTSSIERQSAHAKALVLLARVHKGRGSLGEYEEGLKQALLVQRQLVEGVRGDHPDLVAAHRQAAADMHSELASLYATQHKLDQAVEAYEAAVKGDAGHQAAALALAKLHLDRGDEEAGRGVCTHLLAAHPNNVQAQLLMVQLLSTQEQYTDALSQLQQLVQQQPGDYAALAQLLTLLRRVGRAGEGQGFLHQAQDHASRAAGVAGLHFCQGLHELHCSNHRAALKAFNLARKDSHWEARSVFQMVKMYLYPEVEILWAQAEQGRSPDQQQPLEANLEAVTAAQKLLSDAHVTDECALQHKVLSCYAQMASGKEDDVEAALKQLLGLAGQQRDSVPVLLALASGFMLKKQTPKARNQLKHIQKIRYVADEAEQYERAWLLLADIYIQSGKFDLAQDLCRKCIKHNASCGKAWERLGSILEREQAYKDAAEHYENAWKYDQQSPAVGYKLAFNYMKAARFVDAIDVCHKVLKAHPEYPKMRQDILEKARSNLLP